MIRLGLVLLGCAACVAALWLGNHVAGVMTGLRGIGAVCCLTTAAFLLWLVAVYVMTEGRALAEDVTPADKAALTAEIDALSADTLTLMVSEQGAIFALDESDQAEEAGQ